MTHLVGYTKNNMPVYVDLIESRAARHIGPKPYLLTLAADALQQITAKDRVVTLEYDMGRPIGYDFVVETSESDITFYVQLIRDNTYTRFTKTGKPSPTNYLSIVLHQNDNDSSYSLYDIWVGQQTPPRPGSGQETTESESYWDNHAFVFDNQPIQSRTLTKTRPY
jgi:hypothetical protein